MPYQVAVKQLPDQHAAVLEVLAHPSNMVSVVRSGYGQLAAAITRAGVSFAGPAFYVMEQIFDDEHPARLQLGFPIALPFPADGEVRCTRLAACEVATTIHRGPYDEAGPAYRAIEDWMSSHGLVSIGFPREVYLVSPADTMDPLDYITEIQIPIAHR
jgi:Transcriptional regulator, effector-binding domain/component